MNTFTRILLTCCVMALGLAGATRVLAAIAVNDSFTLNAGDQLFDGQGRPYYLLTPLSNDSDFSANTLNITAMQSSIVFTQGGGTIEIVNASIVEYRFFPNSVSVPSEFTYDLIDPQTSPPSSRATVSVNFLSVDDPCTDPLNADSSFCASLNSSERSQQLSIIAAQTEALLGMQGRQAKQLRNRFSELRNGTNQASVSGLNASIYGQNLALGQWSQSSLNDMTGGGASDSIGDMGRLGFFVNGALAIGEREGDVSTSGYDSDGYNLLFGADYRLSDTLVLGGALGMAKDEIDFARDMGEQAADMISLASFINYYLNDNVYVDGLVIYGQSDLDTERNMLGETANGTTDGNVWTVAMSSGYEATQGAWQYGGYGRVEYSKADVDGYSETGSSFDMTVSDHASKSAEMALGGRVGHAFSLASCVLVPSLDLEWVTQFEDDGRLVGVGVENIDTSFGAYDEGFDKSYANAGLSVSAVFAAGLSSFIRAESNFSDDLMTLRTYSGGVRWEF